MKVLIVEDDVLFAVEVEMLIDKLAYELLPIVDNAKAAIESVERHQPDLMLMDINLSGSLSGIDVAKSIQAQNIPIIFFTSFKSDEILGVMKELEPEALLIKPFDMLTLQASIELAILRLAKSKENKLQVVETEEDVFHRGVLFKNSLFIKDRSVLYKVPFEDMLIIKAEGNYSIIHTAQKKFVLKTSLKKMGEDLKKHNFMQVHRNYIIRLESIDRIDLTANEIFIGEYVIPIGRKYREDLLSSLKVM